MTASRYRFLEPEAPHFLTCTVVGWLPVFTRPEAVQIIFDSWRFLQDNRQLVLFGYVVLENHLHWIAQGPNLPRIVHDFKSFTAHRMIELLESRRSTGLLEQLRASKSEARADRENQVWIAGSHPQLLQNEEMLLQKLTYIHDNPIRRGYVDEPAHWRYSSARDYAGKSGLIPVHTKWIR
jgi:REP-associated tyrosine transposase